MTADFPSVSPVHIAAMALSAAICVALPIVMGIVWHRRTGAKTSSAFVGAGVFFLFAMVLEGLCHRLLLTGTGGLSALITQNSWMFALYGGLMAGLFEETGRMLAFRLFFKKRKASREAVMYGIGHGGFEAAVLVGFTMAANIAVSIMSRSAGPEDGNLAVAALMISSTPPYMFLAGAVERVIATTVHISLSVLVFASLRLERRKLLYPAAILIHGAVNLFPGLYKAGVIGNPLTIEAILLACAAIIAALARRVYRELIDAERSTEERISFGDDNCDRGGNCCSNAEDEDK